MSDRPKLPDNLDIIELRSLCRQYVWYCLISQNSGGYYAEMRRLETHGKIADILEMDHHEAFLADLVHNLDKHGFPLVSPDNESWVRIANAVSKNMVDYLTQNGGGK